MEHSIVTHNGYLTITNPATGNHRTIRIHTQRLDASFGPGRRIVSLLTGSDNTRNYETFGFLFAEVDDDASGRQPAPGRQPTPAIIRPPRIWVFSRKRGPTGHPSNYEKLADMLVNNAKYEARGVVYQFSVRCRRCNRDLTDPQSIILGIGPACRGGGASK